MQFLDFEKPIETLYEEIEKLKSSQNKTDVDMTAPIEKLEAKIAKERKNIYSNLSDWQKSATKSPPQSTLHQSLYRLDF